MNLRKIIREEINRLLNEEESNIGASIGGTLSDIETALSTDYNNVEKMIKTQTIDTKNKDNEIKANLQLKSKLDQNAPHRKGLEREIPELQKDLVLRQKQLKDLKNTQQGIKDAQAQIAKQKQDLETQSAEMQAKTGSKSSNQSILPSLESPI